MKTASPTLLPLLRSRSQGDVLAVIMLDPERERSLSEIAEEARTSLPPSSGRWHVWRRAAWSPRRDAGTRVWCGRSPTRWSTSRWQISWPSPSGQRRCCATRCRAGVHLWLVGSSLRPAVWPVPADIDLLVIGRPDRGKLADAVAGAESVIRREVNVRRVTAAAWNADDSSFKRTVLSRPVVDVVGKHDE